MKNKNENTILKDAIVLFLITLVSGLALGFVHQITKKPIEDQKMASKITAYRAVFEEAVDFGYSDKITAIAESADSLLKDSGQSFGNVIIEEVVEAKDASRNVLGYVVTVTTKDGYNGTISLSIGVANDGKILGIEMLEISETAGLGLKAADPEFKNQYKDKTVESFKVSKDGKSSDNEIDVISGATITSNAVTNAVNAALYFVNDCINQ